VPDKASEEPTSAAESTDDQPSAVDEPKVTPTEEAVPDEAAEAPTQPETMLDYDQEDDILPEEVIYNLEDVPVEDGYSAEERSAMDERYAETMKIFRSGELVNGKIVAISESNVAVDIGFKSEGNIPVEEFDDLDKLKVGDEVEVLIDSIEDEEGTLVLSKRKAEFTRVWENINDLYKTGKMIEAPIMRRIKGGMVVDLFGVEAFLPGSQIDVHPVRDFDALVNVSMDFRIIKVNNARKNVVLSHKVLVEESLREIREKVLSEIEEGQIVEGVVKNITDFGVFVDLGGVDGLLHITDLSWGRVSHPSDIVELDEKIKIKVLRYDKEKQRISLGLKQLKEHHWDEIEENYPVQSKAKGKVVSLVKYGAFIELEEGIEGLVHISEMSWTQHIKHPSQVVSVGEEIDVFILGIDRDARKISLGMKQCLEDPWERLEKKFTSGSKHKGIVRDLVPFGAFVELEQNIDGLIHISDLSWVRKVRHPGEIVKKGEEIEVVVLNFNRNERRIALGLKQLEPDPWNGFEREYSIRSRTEGSVVRVLEKGIVVMLPLGVEGFIPNSQLGKSLAGENKRDIKEGDNLSLEVIEFDKVNHRIVLSHFLIERAKEKSSHRAYRDSAPVTKTTIGDVMRQAKEDKDAKKAKETAKLKEPVTTEKVKVEAPEKAEEKPEKDEIKTVEAVKVKEEPETEAKTDEVVKEKLEQPEIAEAEVVTAPVTEEAKAEEEEDKKDEKKKPEAKAVKKDKPAKKKPVAKVKAESDSTEDKSKIKTEKKEEPQTDETETKTEEKPKPIRKPKAKPSKKTATVKKASETKAKKGVTKPAEKVDDKPEVKAKKKPAPAKKPKAKPSKKTATVKEKPEPKESVDDAGKPTEDEGKKE
ncbi:30S ribosomal protein S1, partial [bacterium]|nr:30S ribosomal protein S1 [bacterium]